MLFHIVGACKLASCSDGEKGHLITILRRILMPLKTIAYDCVFFSSLGRIISVSYQAIIKVKFCFLNRDKCQIGNF